MRARWTNIVYGGSRPYLFQTFWRPGTSGGSDADATDILSRVHVMLEAIKGYLHNSVVYTATTEVDALEDTTGALTGSWTGAAPAPVLGTGAGDALSPAMAAISRSNSAVVVGGRFLKGRTYLNGFDEAMNGAGGTPSGIVVAFWNGAWNAMLTGGATASFPVVWHRPTKALPASGTSAPVINYQLQPNYWGVQRRRRF